ncbi:MAG: hypothetical protein AAFX94_02430 [Myxococcota bacterium]
MKLLFVLALFAAKEREPEPPADAETRCEVCHSVDGWEHVSYRSHDETRFPLVGAHVVTPCEQCHSAGIRAPITNTTCASCHFDPHGGRLGNYCEGCHDPQSWKGAFDPDAHRRSNFPLSGGHAFIPCQECHLVAQERLIVSAAQNCSSCHRDDYLAAARTTVDHAASNFSPICESCHFTWDFQPARFVGHDVCFQINGGPHSGESCNGCHTRLAGTVANGACNTNTFACTSCHVHGIEVTERQHREVPGYDYQDQKCYACHRFAAGGPR